MVMQKWKSLCAVIKSHVILGPSKLPAAYHSLSEGYLPYYILSGIRQQRQKFRIKKTRV